MLQQEQPQFSSERHALNVLCRHKQSAFTQRAFQVLNPRTQYNHAWSIDLVGEYLEAAYRREIKRLIINIPPRTLKSTQVTVAFPAWVWEKDQSVQFVAASYAQSLSLKHATDCRTVLRSQWYKQLAPHVSLKEDQDTKARYQTVLEGQRFSTSVGGAATGEGGDFLIVDDPHNPSQVLSDAKRAKALEWFDGTFYTRLNDKKNGVIIVVMQRLHQKDLTGHLMGNNWEHLVLPSICEKRTTYCFAGRTVVREVGDILNPDREGQPELDEAKELMGSMQFAAQHQQRPAPAEGAIFLWRFFKWYEERLRTHNDNEARPPLKREYKRIVQSWDTAQKDDQLNDPSCCTTWGETYDGDWHLLHVLVRRMTYPDLKKCAIEHFADWGADMMLIEDKSSGQSLIQDLRKEEKIPIIAINPTTDKETRASSASAVLDGSNLAKSGQILFPEDKKENPWLNKYLDELLQFPNSEHKDQVDSTSQFLNWLRKTSAPGGIVTKVKGL